MALTGNTVQSTYLDLVQLEQSGAGLPSHAGKEAALYDGSGAQILGRTAQRHWLDPHPDAAAFAETWEFSTVGDMTQGQLESAGWTFDADYAGVVSGGLLLTTNNGLYSVKRASIAVSLAGDFDICCVMFANLSYGSVEPYSTRLGTFGVADTVTNVAHHMSNLMTNSYQNPYSYHSGTWAGLAGTATSKSVYGTYPVVLRISRVSGTIYFNSGTPFQSNFLDDDTSFPLWETHTSVADSTTFNKIFVSNSTANSTAGGTAAFAFIRRFQ